MDVNYINTVINTANKTLESMKDLNNLIPNLGKIVDSLSEEDRQKVKDKMPGVDLDALKKKGDINMNDLEKAVGNLSNTFVKNI